MKFPEKNFVAVVEFAIADNVGAMKATPVNVASIARPAPEYAKLTMTV